MSVEPAVTETEHETLVDQACDHANEVEANLELKPWKNVPLKDRIGQFGQEMCCEYFLIIIFKLNLV